MDKKIVDEMIDELESADTTYQNCNDLAALYKLRDEFGASKVESEIEDILPAYRKYVEVKTKYQRGDTTKEVVIEALNFVCREIFDLVKTLYSCSDMPLERVKIQNMVQALSDSIGYH